MASFDIRQFTCRSDNFGVLVHEAESGTTIAIDAPLDGAEFNGEVIVEISGADEIGLARLVANLYDESGSVFLGPIGSTSGLTSLGTTSDSASWTIPAGLADGTYTIRAAARDLAGNVQTTASTFIIATAAEPVAGSAGGPTLAPTTSGGGRLSARSRRERR